MIARITADTLVVFHLAFILFVVIGGLLALCDRRFALLHLPALAWGMWIEFGGAICPLTGWENTFRVEAQGSGYAGGFVEHYIIPLIYPDALTSRTQLALGLGVLLFNVPVYMLVWRKWARTRVASHQGGSK